MCVMLWLCWPATQQDCNLKNMTQLKHVTSLKSNANYKLCSNLITPQQGEHVSSTAAFTKNDITASQSCKKESQSIWLVGNIAH